MCLGVKFQAAPRGLRARFPRMSGGPGFLVFWGPQLEWGMVKKMAISWLKVLKAAPGAKKAIDALVAPGASQSSTVWYNLVKAAFTVLVACGVTWQLSEEEMLTLGSFLAVMVPTLATVGDMVANLWLRVRTHEPLSAKAARSE